jgi:hypoxanthine phosphoribosyltransferase
VATVVIGEQTTDEISPRATGVYGDDIETVLVSQAQIAARVDELAAEVAADYADREVLLVGVLKGAVLFMSDFARALSRPSQMEFMAVSSYGSATSSSGVVRILKDLDRDISGRHVLIIEDIVDSGLTLSWLMKNLESPTSSSSGTDWTTPSAIGSSPSSEPCDRRSMRLADKPTG